MRVEVESNCIHLLKYFKITILLLMYFHFMQLCNSAALQRQNCDCLPLRCHGKQQFTLEYSTRVCAQLHAPLLRTSTVACDAVTYR